MKWLNSNQFKTDLVKDYCLTTSNQKEAISETISHWHVWILLCILTSQNLWHFNFLFGLAPGLLDGFSIGRYEEKHEPFDLFAAKFKSRAMWFSGGKSLWCWSPFKTSFLRNSKWRNQNPSKSLKKPLLRQRNNNISQVKYFNVYLTLSYIQTVNPVHLLFNNYSSESIAHEAEGRMGYCLRGHEG